MAARATRTLSQAEAFATIRAAFEKMAYEPLVELLESNSVPSGDTVLEIKVRRRKALMAAPYRAYITSNKRVRAFADKGIARLEEVAAPGDRELDKVDALEVVLKCREQLQGLVPNLHSIFPRYAFYSPGSGRWEILTGTITNPDTGLRQYEIETDLRGNVLSIKRVGDAW
jgi:hypothetical protein